MPRPIWSDALEELIEAKGEGKMPPQPKEEAQPTGRIVDLMAALEQSVKAARDSRGDDPDGEHVTVHDLDSPTKKKTAAKKTAPKKAAAKRTTGRKPRSA
ncbi:hypothetical protein [Streptomyces sp. NBC_00370]|uniref:hypothetical protein n=1 Tax=Streptomyces sp. NBC_00370 TaxID=2975728 RepID=UPI002E2644DC